MIIQSMQKFCTPIIHYSHAMSTIISSQLEFGSNLVFVLLLFDVFLIINYGYHWQNDSLILNFISIFLRPKNRYRLCFVPTGWGLCRNGLGKPLKILSRRYLAPLRKAFTFLGIMMLVVIFKKYGERCLRYNICD